MHSDFPEFPRSSVPIKMQNIGGWLYPTPGIHPSMDLVYERAKQYYHKVDDKYVTAFKLHVTLSAETYEEDRNVVATYLYQNGYAFKMHPLRSQKGDEDRSFTIYPKTETDLQEIVLTLIGAISGWNLTPGRPSDDGIIVPGTRGVITYHVERVSSKLLYDMRDAGAFSDESKRALGVGKPRFETTVKSIVRNKRSPGYLSGSAYGSVRMDAMKFLLKKSPLGFLY